MKLKKRENRRLVGLERLFTDTYMINADTDKDIIQISDFDGSDSNALKTVGLRGGLIGEVFLICQKLQKLPGFDQLKFKSPLFMDSLVQFWTNFVSEGYTVLIGVDQSFEKNSGTSLERLDSETVFSMAQEEFDTAFEYLKIHYSSTFIDTLLPGAAERRARRIKKVAYVEPAGEEPINDADDADEEQQAKNLEKDLNNELLAQEISEEVEPEEDNPLALSFDEYLEVILKLIMDETRGLRCYRFVKQIPKVFEIPEEPDEGSAPIAAAPKVMTLFVPVPPPAIVEDDNFGGQDQNQKSGEKQPPEQPNPDEPVEDDEEKPIVVPEVFPFVPNSADFDQDFEKQASNIDMTKREMNLQSIHIPLLRSLTRQFVRSVQGVIKGQEDLQQIDTIVHDLLSENVEEIKQAAAADGRDVLFINSY